LNHQITTTENSGYFGINHTYMKNIDKAIEAFETAAELSKEFMNTDAYVAPILAVLNHQKVKFEEESEFDGLETEDIAFLKECKKIEESNRLQAEAAERLRTLRVVKVAEVQEIDLDEDANGEAFVPYDNDVIDTTDYSKNDDDGNDDVAKDELTIEGEVQKVEPEIAKVEHEVNREIAKVEPDVAKVEPAVEPIVNVIEPAVLPVALSVIPVIEPVKVVIEPKTKRTYKKKVNVEAVAS
jgi:hypothetical protein